MMLNLDHARGSVIRWHQIHHVSGLPSKQLPFIFTYGEQFLMYVIDRPFLPFLQMMYAWLPVRYSPSLLWSHSSFQIYSIHPTTTRDPSWLDFACSCTMLKFQVLYIVIDCRVWSPSQGLPTRYSASLHLRDINIHDRAPWGFLQTPNKNKSNNAMDAYLSGRAKESSYILNNVASTFRSDGKVERVGSDVHRLSVHTVLPGGGCYLGHCSSYIAASDIITIQYRHWKFSIGKMGVRRSH